MSFNPNQPRDPAGSATGGQWAGGSGGGGGRKAAKKSTTELKSRLKAAAPTPAQRAARPNERIHPRALANQPDFMRLQRRHDALAAHRASEARLADERSRRTDPLFGPKFGRLILAKGFGGKK